MTGWHIAVTVAVSLGLAVDNGVWAESIASDQGRMLVESGHYHEQEATEEAEPFNIERMFDGETLIVEEAGDRSQMPTRGPDVEIGGWYRFALTGIAAWSALGDLWRAPLEPDARGIVIDLGAIVFLDARPLPDFRIFGKTYISYPFGTEWDTVPQRAFDDIVSIRELFSDFTLGDTLFLRGGKHTIAWGVGYFFSPADVLNLAAIDPNDPDADREGPVSLRMNLPVDFHNLYLYVIADRTHEGVQLAFAPKAEVVLGGSEVGIGAYYHPDRVPRAMLTLSSGFLDIDLFGELEVSMGSDRRFVEAIDVVPDNPFGLRTVKYSERVFAALTGGLRYTYSPLDLDWSATFVGQYLWNGEGYEDGDILRMNPLGVGRLLTVGDLHPGDLSFPGRHYAAASLGLSLNRDSTWSLTAFWISNLSDGSGRVSPSLTMRLADHFSLRAVASASYGEEGSEMTPFGSQMSVSITATLGSGRF